MCIRDRSGDLAAMDTQNMTDESSNKTVIDSEHQSVIECDSVSSDTRELNNVVVDSSANTSDSQMDTESPRLVHFFKRGRLSIPPDDKKKVVCVGSVSYTHLDVYKRQGIERRHSKDSFSCISTE